MEGVKNRVQDATCDVFVAKNNSMDGGNARLFRSTQSICSRDSNLLVQPRLGKTQTASGG
jgi:hypothetical protein